MTPELAAARDALLDCAEGLNRDLQVNRRVLDGAHAVGDRLIRAFGGGETPPPVYGAGTDPEASTGPAGGALLNTRA